MFRIQVEQTPQENLQFLAVTGESYRGDKYAMVREPLSWWWSLQSGKRIAEAITINSSFPVVPLTPIDVAKRIQVFFRQICPASAWNGVSFLRCREHTSNGTGDSQFILLPGGKNPQLLHSPTYTTCNRCTRSAARYIATVWSFKSGNALLATTVKRVTMYKCR